VFQLFQTVADELGTAIIAVTHDHRYLDLIDRVLEMSDGHLAEGVVPG
jgi:putative ABC transport system ATP-binding protein